MDTKFVMQALDNATAETLIHDLVAIESQSTHEAEASQFLVNWMRDNDYDEAFVDEAGNAVGIIGNGEREIVLLGHIDTFSGNPPVKIEGRKLYGRGAVDAKGSVSTFAVAGLRATLAQDIRLIVIGAVEEEASSSKGARFAVTQYQPEMCVIGEPSHWDRITLGYKGRLLLEYEWQGALAHSAGQTMSAPEHAVAYWQKVLDYTRQFNADEPRIFGQLDATLQEINSGYEGAYGWSRALIGFRIPPSITPQEIEADLPADAGTVRACGYEIACIADKNSVLSRAFRGAIRANNGNPRFVHKTGTADMNIVAPIWNCPIVAYGPGDSSLDHTPEEHLDLDEYLRAINVLADTLSRL